MTDRYIEKSFLSVLCISLILHLGVFAALYFFPPSPTEPPKEPVFIDLQQMPVLEQPRETASTKPLQAEKLNKSQKAEPEENVVKQKAIKNNKNYLNLPKVPQTQAEPGEIKQSLPTRPVERQPQQIESGSSVSSLLKQKKKREQPSSQDDLSIRQNIAKNIEGQIKNKLNKENKAGGFGVGDDIDLSLVSFARRVLDEANSHLKYPPQAKQLGLEGIGTVEVTYNRKGEIVDIHITKSINKLFDEAVITAFNKAVVGPLPRAYKDDTVTLPLVYFFQLPPQGPR